jgi:dihydrofolate reductase
MTKRFKAIAAMSENRVIGNGPDLPWHLPEEFKWFKQATSGQVVVMGRTTFESLGRPLPNRINIIVSRSGYQYPVTSLDDIDVNAYDADVFICGGAQIYELALPDCSDLYLTHVKRVVDGDVFFPAFEHLFDAGTELRDTPDFRIMHYRRVE